MKTVELVLLVFGQNRRQFPTRLLQGFVDAVPALLQDAQHLALLLRFEAEVADEARFVALLARSIIGSLVRQWGALRSIVAHARALAAFYLPGPNVLPDW